MDVKPVVVNGSVVVVDEDDDEVEISSLISPQTMNSPATRYLYSATEKPLISSRGSTNRRIHYAGKSWLNIGTLACGRAFISIVREVNTF
ncbi:hypothetical protein LguiA_022807 [Lonicera macranthoides]